MQRRSYGLEGLPAAAAVMVTAAFQPGPAFVLLSGITTAQFLADTILSALAVERRVHKVHSNFVYTIKSNIVMLIAVQCQSLDIHQDSSARSRCTGTKTGEGSGNMSQIPKAVTDLWRKNARENTRRNGTRA